MNAIFPDISFYQDDNTTPAGVDFEKMKAGGAPGVIIRAGQNLWVDPDFSDHWNRSKAAGIARGSYWFYDSRADPKRQAELWIQTLGNDLGELPLCADFEDRYGGAYFGWKYWHDFLQRVKELVPFSKEKFIYTGYYYWLEEMLRTPVESRLYFKQYPLWIAAYNAERPSIPPPFTEWTFWQYTDNGDGEPYGVESKNIDLNQFNGDDQAFYERFNIDPDNGGGEIPMPNNLLVTVVWPQGASAKNGPNTGGSAVHVFNQGDKFVASELVPDNTDPNNSSKKWAKVAEGQYINKYVAVLYPSSSSGQIVRCTWVEIDPDPTPTPAGSLQVVAESLLDGSFRVEVTTEDKTAPVYVYVKNRRYIPDPNETVPV